MHHGSFSAATAGEVIRNINHRLQQAHKTVHQLDWLMLTFGTAYVYEQKETGRVVSNCHKLPESNFNRRLLSVDEIVNEYTSLIAGMTARNPNLKVLFLQSARSGIFATECMPINLVNRPCCLQSTACKAIVSEAGFLLSCLRDST